jgi:hypothetical protein
MLGRAWASPASHGHLVSPRAGPHGVIPLFPLPFPLPRPRRKTEKGEGGQGHATCVGDSPCSLLLPCTPSPALHSASAPHHCSSVPYFSPTHRVCEATMARRHACHRLSTLTAEDSKIGSASRMPPTLAPKALAQTTLFAIMCPHCGIFCATKHHAQSSAIKARCCSPSPSIRSATTLVGTTSRHDQEKE